MIAMILAAGRGERLRPLTDEQPKAMVEVGGQPLLGWHLARLQRAGVDTVVINLDWLGEQIVAHVGDGSRYGLNVIYSPEYGNVLETAGGIQRALPMLGDEPFWVINADVFTDFELHDVEFAGGSEAHLVMVPRPAFKTHGDFDLQAGKIISAAEPSMTFSGMACYQPRFFAEVEAGRQALAPLLYAAIERDKLAGELHRGVWEDVGTLARLDRARQQFSG